MRDLLKAVTATHGHFFRKYPLGSISILMYHRITGDLPVELDLPFEVFRRQIAWLADSGSIIPYHEAVDRLLTGKRVASMRLQLPLTMLMRIFIHMPGRC